MSTMKYLKAKFGILFLSGIDLMGLNAQDVIPASGGSALGNEGAVSFTIGQVVCSTHKGTIGSLAEGVQQPYEISIETGISESTNTNLVLLAYPNPTADFLTIEVKELNNEHLSYRFFDVNGMLLMLSKIYHHETNITMNKFLTGTYFLEVRNNDKIIQTFKIVKN